MAQVFLTVNDAAARARVEGVLTSGAVGIPLHVSISGDRWEGLTAAASLMLDEDEEGWGNYAFDY